VAPLVNTTSEGWQPRASARVLRARSTAARASCPKLWTLLGLPKTSPKYGRMASSTRGSVGVVAA
jgi:hypothetical protein